VKVFTVDYQHNGKRWAVNLEAENFEDAEARVEAMFRTGEVSELVAQMDNPTQERIDSLMAKLGIKAE
jgi:hypothetical protein